MNIFLIIILLIAPVGGAYLTYKKRKRENADSKFFGLDLIFLVITTVALSYGASFALGFSGWWCWWDALIDPLLGQYVSLFVIIVIGIVWISFYLKKLSWTIARKWLIAEAIIVAIAGISVSILPGLNLHHSAWVQNKRIEIMNHEANAGTCFQVTNKEAYLYAFKQSDVFMLTDKNSKPIKLEMGKKYDIIREGDIRQVGPIRFTQIYYSVDITSENTKMEFGWVRLDDGTTVPKTAPEGFAMKQISNNTFLVTFFTNQSTNVLQWKKGVTITFTEALDKENTFIIDNLNPNKSYPIPLNFPLKARSTNSLILKGQKGKTVTLQMSELNI